MGESQVYYITTLGSLRTRWVSSTFERLCRRGDRNTHLKKFGGSFIGHWCGNVMVF